MEFPNSRQLRASRVGMVSGGSVTQSSSLIGERCCRPVPQWAPERHLKLSTWFVVLGNNVGAEAV